MHRGEAKRAGELACRARGPAGAKQFMPLSSGGACALAITLDIRVHHPNTPMDQDVQRPSLPLCLVGNLGPRPSPSAVATRTSTALPS